MIDKDKIWVLPSILLIGSTWLTQPTQPIKFFFIYMIYFIVKSLYSRRFAIKELIAILGGYLVSFIWWATKFKAMFTMATFNPGASDTAAVSDPALAVVINTSNGCPFPLWLTVTNAFPKGVEIWYVAPSNF